MIQLTMLNAMAGADFEVALDRHLSWNLRLLDLKDGIFGRGILDLSDTEADRAAHLITCRKLEVYCFSTGIGYADIEQGEAAFRAAFAGRIDRAIALSRVLRPRVVRLLAARTSRRSGIADATAYILKTHTWLLAFYRDAIDRLAAAGLQVAIENEVHDCIWSNPTEILSFFDALDRDGRVFLTYDVQNLWQMGTFPSLDVYAQLRPRIGHVHLKGGQADPGNPARPLRFSSALEDADWPVAPIIRQVIADGVSPVICLNPSHGQPKPGYNYTDVVGRDVQFMRRTFPEVAR